MSDIGFRKSDIIVAKHRKKTCIIITKIMQFHNCDIVSKIRSDNNF